MRGATGLLQGLGGGGAIARRILSATMGATTKLAATIRDYTDD